MSIESLHALVALAAASESESGPGATPYIIGGLVFLALLGAMMGLLSFGKGREHT